MARPQTDKRAAATMTMLGIDLGTSSVKTLILDQQGRVLSTGKAGYSVRSPRPGWAESDPDDWWQATLSAVQAAVQQVPHVTITAIGLSGQMHGIVPTDDKGNPTRPALLWPDTRAEAELAHYQALPTATLQRLANPLVPGMAGPLLCWLAHHEAPAYQTTRWALQPKDWLRLRLTNLAATDASDASATLLYDLPADGWADDVISTLGLRRDLFAPLLPSHSPAGTLSPQAATALGLPLGLPVATGAADTAAALLGSGLLTPGPIQLTLGTGAQLVQLCTTPAPDTRVRTHLYRAADGSHWYRMAAVQNAGLALDWVCRTLNASWDAIYESATSVPPGSHGLTFLPYLTRERAHHTSRQNTAAFLGMRIDHQREDLLHAALEGVAFGIRMALEALPGANAISTLRLAGGGSIHPAWRQMLANILGRELVSVEAPDASARGAALLAGIANGTWTDAMATMSAAPPATSAVTPDAQQATYNELYQRYGE